MYPLRRILIAAGAAALAAAPALAADDRPAPVPQDQPSAAPQSAPGGAAAQQDWAPAQPDPAKTGTTIEQKHLGRRVSEVIVTPGGFNNYHYTMQHLDDQEPGTLMQPHPQLSVPNLIRFDFNF